MHFTEYTHPDDLPNVLELYGELIAGRRDRYELAMRYLGKDGRIIWAQVAESALGGEQGTPRFGLTMVQDITERRLAHEALQVSEAELRRQKQYLEALLELSPLRSSRPTSTTTSPPGMPPPGLFGYTQAEALEHRRPGCQVRRAACRGGRGQSADRRRSSAARHPAPAKTERSWTSTCERPAILVGGKMVGSYAIYHDLSDVHRQKQYFESLLEISPSAIITVGNDDKVTAWNPAAEALRLHA